MLFKILICKTPFFEDTFNSFILMFCILITSLIINLVYIYDFLSSFMLLQKQGSKLEYFKDNIMKR